MKPRALLAALSASSLVAGALGVAAGSVPSCQTYVPPPTASLVGIDGGILQNALGAVVLQFSTPVEPATVQVAIAPFAIDAYGNLPGEVDYAGTATSLDVRVSYSASAQTNVTSATWSSDGTTLTLTPTATALPAGPSLVLLVSPGLTSSTTGTVLHYQERIPFSFAPLAPVQSTPRPTEFKSGAYFFILSVEKPIPVTLKVFAAIDVNPRTGEFYGQFTAALRNSDPTRCSPACTGGLVCELLPGPEMCVMMSTPPVSVYESTDFLPKATAPDGYTFEMHGWASNVGDAGAANIETSPGVLDVPSPTVSIQGLTFTAQFAPVDGGLVLGSGSLTATKTYLGMFPEGPGTGTLTALSIPDADVPSGLPQPAIRDGGVGGAADGGDAGDAGDD